MGTYLILFWLSAISVSQLLSMQIKTFVNAYISIKCVWLYFRKVPYENKIKKTKWKAKSKKQESLLEIMNEGKIEITHTFWKFNESTLKILISSFNKISCYILPATTSEFWSLT
jgi:hypothetical protein